MNKLLLLSLLCLGLNVSVRAMDDEWHARHWDQEDAERNDNHGY